MTLHCAKVYGTALHSTALTLRYTAHYTILHCTIPDCNTLKHYPPPPPLPLPSLPHQPLLSATPLYSHSTLSASLFHSLPFHSTSLFHSSSIPLTHSYSPSTPLLTPTPPLTSLQHFLSTQTKESAAIEGPSLFQGGQGGQSDTTVRYNCCCNDNYCHDNYYHNYYRYYYH